ncbi:hypothetical protein OEZ85_006637 [Tetradesmus obliquus]|uniref:Uncharacterized protein n=1 Tax=Tetradesmus obliquus TaxID=3088 RepID=A0ABY8TXC6_TETOB|nr:hypothetical protein OEZ85_006637 [Tetradesmus obliquus]
MHSAFTILSSSNPASCLLRPGAKHKNNASRQAVVCNWTRGGGRGGYLTPMGPAIQQQAGAAGRLQFNEQQQQQQQQQQRIPPQELGKAAKQALQGH